MSNGIKINVDNVCKKFGDNVIALDNVSLNFDAGALHGVIGPAGAGKTTLLRLILQLLDQDSGTITFLRGNTVLEFNNIKNTIAYMPEQQSLYADLSIKEHLEFFSTMYGLSNEQYTTKSNINSNELRLVLTKKPFGRCPSFLPLYNTRRPI